MEQWSTKVEWKFASMEFGEQCALGRHIIRLIITGMSLMQELYVVSLDTKSLVGFNIVIHVLYIAIATSIVQTCCEISVIELQLCIIN